MATNDKILIDGILDEYKDVFPEKPEGELFEFFALSQILKFAALSTDDIEYGIVDGRDDGGIDGFYIFVNGHLLQDVKNFSWPKSSGELDIWIITCKHHDTYNQAPLDNLCASISELFDFSLNPSQFCLQYADEVLKMRARFLEAYKKTASTLISFNLHFLYVSRGDSSKVPLMSSVKSRADQCVLITKNLFANCEVDFSFIGSTELLALFRKRPKYNLLLPFHQSLSAGTRYVVLTNLIDFYKFVTEDGKLRRYLFDSNVRDFMGVNRVNEEIKDTLENTSSPDFWWLNNGITILATQAYIIGQSISLDNIQIVNGLQTTESIFRYFSSGNIESDHRSVLVKIIVTEDPVVRDAIIRATNNQTSVEISALHATDKIQRDIEDILLKHEIYYERRTNYYKNDGKIKLISPLYLASGYLSLILKLPYQAISLKTNFMQNDVAYKKIFNDAVDLNIWPVIAKIVLNTDVFLNKVKSENKITANKFQRKMRHIISFLTISNMLRKFNFNGDDLFHISLDNFDNECKTVWNWFVTHYKYSRKTPQFGTPKVFFDMLEKFSIDFSIDDFLTINNRPRLAIQSNLTNLSMNSDTKLDLEFIDRVKKLLPPQPWRQGMHIDVMKSLGCSNQQYNIAVQYLIKSGDVYNQVDGVLYDLNGRVITLEKD